MQSFAGVLPGPDIVGSLDLARAATPDALYGHDVLLVVLANFGAIPMQIAISRILVTL